MAIDWGFGNICVVIFKSLNVQYFINGKPLKSKNVYYNKKIARLTSIQMKTILINILNAQRRLML
jgi:hypothetical protein